MRSPSIEYFHTKIDKLIRMAQSYTEMDGLEFIIKSCRLKPHTYLFEERNDKIVLHRWWVDEFGNSLHITKHKKIHLVYNDLHLDKKKIICTDLYYGLSIDKIVKMSKLAYLCAGKDEDLYQDCYLLTLLGIDDYLRCYLYWYGEWQQVSPLWMEMKLLRLLATNTDIKYFRKLSNAAPIPCVSSSSWLFCLPANEDFLDIIKGQYEMLLPIIGENNG